VHVVAVAAGAGALTDDAGDAELGGELDLVAAVGQDAGQQLLVGAGRAGRALAGRAVDVGGVEERKRAGGEVATLAAWTPCTTGPPAPR
jgi:hypothetical protein